MGGGGQSQKSSSSSSKSSLAGLFEKKFRGFGRWTVLSFALLQATYTFTNGTLNLFGDSNLTGELVGYAYFADAFGRILSHVKQGRSEAQKNTSFAAVTGGGPGPKSEEERRSNLLLALRRKWLQVGGIVFLVIGLWMLLVADMD